MRNVPKELKFPLAGLGRDLSYRDSTLPTEERTYATPMAKNVIGSCSFSGRLRGGSRPGLAAVEGIESASNGRWLWPNGEKILWPDGKEMSFADYGDGITLPDGSRIFQQHRTFTIYRDRLFKAEGSVWMASRTGDFANFDFGADRDDVSRAVAGNIALAGRKGEDITAFAPVNDQVMFIATRRALRMISGEPTSAVKAISDSVGIVSANAWCFDGQRVYFMGPNGLYGMVPGESPLILSARLPEDLKGFADATLVYDPENRGIHVFGDSDWFYDIEAKAFWPVEYPPTKMPEAGGVAVIGGVNRVVFRGVDGNWYRWDDDAEDDEGESIASTLAIGPFRCGLRDDGDGMLDSVVATLAKGSVDANISVYTAKSAEEAVTRSEDDDFEAMAAFTAHGGWNATCRPRVRGAWCVLVIRATGRWAYESILANIKTWGRLRP